MGVARLGLRLETLWVLELGLEQVMERVLEQVLERVQVLEQV